VKLSAAVALSTGKKNEAKTDLSKLYQSLSKNELFQGLSRVYQPLADDGEKFPAESKLLQMRVGNVLSQVGTIMSDLFDCVATQEYGNTHAKGDVDVNGAVILKDVPVPYLLFLEKQLSDMLTVVSKLPVNDPSQNWSWDEANQQYRSEIVQTAKTKKSPRVIEKAPATVQHPAQVELIYEDVVVGYWTKYDFSGALSANDRAMLVDRVRILRDAVIKARETANSADVNKVSVGAAVFNFIFGSAN
jgi:hypothetical protein